MKQISLALLTLTLCSPARAGDAPAVSSEQIYSSSKTITGQQIVVPANPNVVVSMVTFPPGAKLAVHKHPWPHYVYVLEGTLIVSNIESGKMMALPAGSFFAEMNNTWHYGRNDGATPVKLLAIDQLPAGVTSNIVLKDAAASESAAAPR